MGKVALLATVHNPKGKNIDLFRKLVNDIKNNYSEVFITISNETSEEFIQEIKVSGFQWKVIPKLGAAHARREVVSFGLTGKSDYFHYCDFDRLLTWCNSYLPELENVVNKIKEYDYLIIGRTDRAFITHPIEWIETEKITNKICSLELGVDVDITAGSCAFSRKCAEYITLHSKAKMTDAEWPMIVRRIGNLEVSHMKVEGLEYYEETNGLTRTISESEKWLGRLKLSVIISESAMKTGK